MQAKCLMMKKPTVTRDLVASQLVKIDKSLHSFLLHFCAKADFCDNITNRHGQRVSIPVLPFCRHIMRMIKLDLELRIPRQDFRRTHEFVHGIMCLQMRCHSRHFADWTVYFFLLSPSLGQAYGKVKNFSHCNIAIVRCS